MSQLPCFSSGFLLNGCGAAARAQALGRPSEMGVPGLRLWPGSAVGSCGHWGIEPAGGRALSGFQIK